MSDQRTRWERPHFRRARVARRYMDADKALAVGLITTGDAEAMSDRADRAAERAQARIDARVKFIPRKP